MNNGQAFIPIVLFLTIGIVLALYLYFRSKERQAIIDKNFNAEEIKELFILRKGTNTLVVLGIISIFFGIGLGLGIFLEEEYHRDFVVPLSLFVFTGAGFVLAGRFKNSHYLDEELQLKREKEEENDNNEF